MCKEKPIQGFQPDLGSMLLRALGTQGDIPGAVGGAIIPTIQLDDFTQREYWWLRRMQGFGTFGQQAAVVGQVSGLQLRPIQGGSNIIAVVSNLIITNGNATPATFLISLAIAPGAAGTLGICKTDARQASTVIPGGVSLFTAERWSSAVAPANFGHLVRLPTQTSLVIPGEWVISSEEGLSFIVQSLANNTICEASWQWRERSTLQTEQ